MMIYIYDIYSSICILVFIHFSTVESPEPGVAAGSPPAASRRRAIAGLGLAASDARIVVPGIPGIGSCHRFT